jgi:hypothetical protein
MYNMSKQEKAKKQLKKQFVFKKIKKIDNEKLNNLDINELKKLKKILKLFNEGNIKSSINKINKYIKSLAEPEPETEPINSSILMIYNNKYIDDVNRLKQFRENKGYTVFTDEAHNNDDYDTIKKRVKAYNDTYDIKYIILFGTIEEVPTKFRAIDEQAYQSTFNDRVTEAASDISYGIFDNISKKIEIIVGRITPGDNIHSWIENTPELTDEEKIQNVTNQIDKIIEYENIIDNLPNINKNANEFTRIIGIAGNEGEWSGIDGLADNVYMRGELEKLQESNINCNFVELFQSIGNSGHIDIPNPNNQNNNYDLEGNPTSIDLQNTINNGSPLVLYVGHSSEVDLYTTGFHVDDVSKLNNKGKYFLGSVVGCSIGSHDENYMSLSEQLMVAKDKGSIAMFVSSILQSWTPPMHMQRLLVDKIIESSNDNTIGELFYESIQSNEFMIMDDFWHYHILGDPSTRFLLTNSKLRK